MCRSQGAFGGKLLIERLDAGDVLTNNVELKIHQCAHFDGMEIGVVVGVRYDVHLERIIF